MKGKGNISKKLKLYVYYFSLSSAKQKLLFFNFYFKSYYIQPVWPQTDCNK